MNALGAILRLNGVAARTLVDRAINGETFLTRLAC